MKLTVAASCRSVAASVLVVFSLSAANALDHPVGTVVERWNSSGASGVNAYLQKWDPAIVPGVTDPFAANTEVVEVQPTQKMFFVRVYSGSDPRGSWLMRARDIHGLTAAQIRDRYALPSMPAKITYVTVPGEAKYGLWSGIAGEIWQPGFEWGHGGGLQIKIISRRTDPNAPADPARFAGYSWLPSENYGNPDAIGEAALVYTRSANSGNAAAVAAYLDNSIINAAPYGEMEYVFTALDFLNWSALDPAPFLDAIDRLSPSQFDALALAGRYDSLMTAAVFLDHGTGLAGPGRRAVWTQAIGGFSNMNSYGGHTGFDYTSQGTAVGLDCIRSTAAAAGFGAAYLTSNLGWKAGRGSADIARTVFSVYGRYAPSRFSLSAAAMGGMNTTRTVRNISFSGSSHRYDTLAAVETLPVDGTARGEISGYDLSLYVRGEWDYRADNWNIMPLVQGGYLYGRQEGFTETGAGEMNLQVSPREAQSLLGRLGLRVKREINASPSLKILPALQLLWDHEIPLDNSVITSRFPSLGNSTFDVTGYNEQLDRYTGGAAVTVILNDRLSFETAYDIEWGEHFGAHFISANARWQW